jgi:hypothetical protein
MFEEGLASVMVAHLNVPSLESKPNYPSLFLIMLSQMFQKRIGLSGSYFLQINMKAVSKFSTLGRSIYALFWGTMFYYFRKMPLALDAFRKAYQDSLFTDSRLAFISKDS